MSAEQSTEKAQPCANEFCEHEHSASPEKAALLAAIRKAATTALNSIYGTDDRHEYIALRIADSAVNGTPLPLARTVAETEKGVIPDGTPVTCEGTMVGVPAGTPAIVRHQSPSGHSNLPRTYWIELDDYIYWSFGHSESKGYWGSAAEFEVRHG